MYAIGLELFIIRELQPYSWEYGFFKAHFLLKDPVSQILVILLFVKFQHLTLK
jgi:hypothetical protein